MSETNGRPAFIADGYTITTTIPANPDWHPELEFTFRPLLHVPRVRLLQQIGKCEDAGKGEEMAAKAVAGQVTEWALDLPITPENVGRLEPHLFGKLFSIVAGLEPAAQAAEDTAAKN